MRIKISFKPSMVKHSGSIHHYVNGMIHKLLGSNNKYHNNFSTYAVSSLQGGKLINGGIVFNNGAYLYISFPDSTSFYNDIMMGLLTSDKTFAGDLEFDNKIDECDFKPHKSYDIVRTISPILLKNDNGETITFKDDDFIRIITEKSKKKLIKNGISVEKADSIELIPFHFENGKLKYVKVKNVVNVSSQVMFLVKGDIQARYMLYCLGLGKSTGSGFGSVEIISKN